MNSKELRYLFCNSGNNSDSFSLLKFEEISDLAEEVEIESQFADYQQDYWEFENRFQSECNIEDKQNRIEKWCRSFSTILTNPKECMYSGWQGSVTDNAKAKLDHNVNMKETENKQNNKVFMIKRYDKKSRQSTLKTKHRKLVTKWKYIDQENYAKGMWK